MRLDLSKCGLIQNLDIILFLFGTTQIFCLKTRTIWLSRFYWSCSTTDCIASNSEDTSLNCFLCPSYFFRPVIYRYSACCPFSFKVTCWIDSLPVLQFKSQPFKTTEFQFLQNTVQNTPHQRAFLPILSSCILDFCMTKKPLYGGTV